MDIFDIFNGSYPDGWFNEMRLNYGDGLTNDVILQSVHEASDFFHIDDPMFIQEDCMTGVYTNGSYTPEDDVLLYSREQLALMGITEKEGFDLVMTHEGTHRMLQGMNTRFNSHQEELCCDFMAGVRAGLNHMDAKIMEVSLADTSESQSHPDGQARVEAIESGVAFAEHYMQENGFAPTFKECLAHFSQEVGIDANDHETAQVTLREEEDGNTLHRYTQEEINSNKSRAEHEMRVQESNMRHQQRMIEIRRSGGDPTNLAESQYHSAKDYYEKAKREYQKWSSMKPDR